MDWGDGDANDTATTIVANGGQFDVFANHAYMDAGSATYTVTVTGAGGGTISDSATITVANASLNSAGLTIHPTEGAAFNGAVADFTDANIRAASGDFTATIDWGDGSGTTSGTIVSDGNGDFQVDGTHTYSSFDTDSVGVTIDGAGGGPTSATGTADIADATLNSTGETISAIEGTTTPSVLVAHFTDANPDGVLGTYTATINWGDGSGTSAGTIQSDGSGGYNVFGSHLYAASGQYTISTLIGDGGTSTTTPSSTANVAHGTISPTGVNFSGVEGVAIDPSTEVADFTDTNLSANAAGFTATITWATGHTSSGTVVSDDNGGFEVEGGHTYLHAGSKPISILISGFGDSETTTATGSIANAAMGDGQADRFGRSALFSGVVGSFTDANSSASATDFTATIDWGDGDLTSGRSRSTPAPASLT